jgi:uncharacterized glyoxalase superfamily protein PhnB
MPAGAIVPVVAYDDVPEATGWLCDMFGFTVRWRAGTHRAQLAVGESAIAVVGGGPTPGGIELMVRVDDVHAHHAHAAERGASIVQAPSDFPYGERQYSVEDLGGYRWTFSETIADAAPEEWGGSGGG